MQEPTNLKLYIAVLEGVPGHMVPVLVAHSVLGAHMQFHRSSGEYLSQYGFWLLHSFKKVVLQVNQKEFAKIAAFDNVYLGHENSVLDGNKSCAVVCPRYELPNVLKFAKMWKPRS